MATAKPMPTTSFGSAPTLRNGRKISRSSTSPISGAITNTARITAGAIPQPHATRPLKYIAADTYACAPKARLKTPDTL